MKAKCVKCDWSKEMNEPEDGQSLVGSLSYYMRRHDEEHGELVTTLDFDD